MINLMPAQELEGIIYARRNTQLLRWLVVMLFAIVGAGLIIGAGRLIIDKSSDRVSKQLTAAQQQLQAQKVDEIQSRVEDISSSLKLATQVLSKQVILSKLIQQIGSVLPSGTALTGLQLSKIEGGMDLSVVAKSYQDATQVQVNLTDPDNKLFQQVDINNITCAGSTDPKYQCQASFRVLFTDSNPYTLLGEDNQ